MVPWLACLFRCAFSKRNLKSNLCFLKAKTRRPCAGSESSDDVLLLTCEIAKAKAFNERPRVLAGGGGVGGQSRDVDKFLSDVP